MRVLIARNSDAPTNANIRRVLEALTSAGHSVVVLSRNRACDESLKGYIKKTIKINNLEIDNYGQRPVILPSGVKIVYG